MKGRKRYLVCYDIRDSKRLRDVHHLVKGFGFAMQYSVFVCDLDAIEMIDLRRELGEVIHHREDSIAFVDLGAPEQRGVECFSFMGARPSLPMSGPLIV
jgi:CRISPR-associated protein Cas2